METPTPRRPPIFSVRHIAGSSFLPMLHNIEEYLASLPMMLKECAVAVAADGSGIVSFLAQQGEEVRRFLYATRSQSEGERERS